MAKKEKRRIAHGLFKTVGVGISIVLTLVVLAIYVLSRPEIDRIGQIGILEIIEAKTLDMRFRLRGERKPGNDIIIIAVDEKTGDDLGRWQSSGRLWIAKMLNILHKGGAKVVGFDVSLAKPDEGAALEVADAVKKRYLDNTQDGMSNRAEMLTYLDEVKAAHDYDRQLTEAIQRAGNVVLGIYNFFDRAGAMHLTSEKHNTYSQLINRAKYAMIKFPPGITRQPLKLSRSFGVEPNLQAFSEAAKSFGHFTIIPDRDGYVRQVPLLVDYTVFKVTEQSLAQLHEKKVPGDMLTKLGDLTGQAYPTKEDFLQALEHSIGKEQLVQYKSQILEHAGYTGYYPSLSLEVARLSLDPAPFPIVHALGKEGGGSIDVIQLGDIRIPTDGKGHLLINYYGPGGTFPYYPISDVVLGKIPPETFKDKIVLFGFTSTISQDVHSIPFQPGIYPGVEVHATIIENILHEDFLTRPEWGTFVDALLIFLFGITLSIELPLKRALRGALTVLICLAFVAGITYSLFLLRGIWLNVTFLSLFIILDYLTITSYNLAITTYKYLTEEKIEKELKNAFQHYVSPGVVEQILETPEKLQLGGERKIMTALFSDVRGFTQLSERMTPGELVQFLNDFFTEMTAKVLNYEGTVDKYIGDAIMVFYGAPLEQQDHAFRACKTAVDMLYSRHLS